MLKISSPNSLNFGIGTTLPIFFEEKGEVSDACVDFSQEIHNDTVDDIDNDKLLEKHEIVIEDKSDSKFAEDSKLETSDDELTIAEDEKDNESDIPSTLRKRKRKKLFSSPKEKFESVTPSRTRYTSSPQILSQMNKKDKEKLSQFLEHTVKEFTLEIMKTEF